MRPSGDRWENGVLWEPGTTSELGAVPAPDCESPTDIDLGLTANVEDAGEASSFTVYGYYHGNPIATSPEVAQAKALDHLLNREEARVEKALWTGDLGNTPSLAGTAELLEVDDPYTYVEGLALLEQTVAADYGSLGVIHMTRQMASVGLSLQALSARNGKLTTALGTPVVALFGPTSAERNGPWVEADEALSRYNSCECHYQRQCRHGSGRGWCLASIRTSRSCAPTATAVSCRRERWRTSLSGVSTTYLPTWRATSPSCPAT